jgi:two-component system, NtrC family, nitrogen regulation response regulator NtrX
VVEIRVPPLRERREDIPQMVQHFIADACRRFGLPEKQLAPAAMRACLEAPWRGNARALKSTIEQAVILSSAAEIGVEELFAGSLPEGSADRQPVGKSDSQTEVVATFREAKEKFVEEWEREFFLGALRASGGNISRAAERAGMYRQSFQQKIRELGIGPADIHRIHDSDKN